MKNILIVGAVTALFASFDLVAQERGNEAERERARAERPDRAKAKVRIKSKSRKAQGEKKDAGSEFDKNKDGKITKAEAGAAWQKLSGMDANKDGVVSKVEYAAATKKDAKDAGLDMDAVTALWNRMDMNGDGKLSKKGDGRAWLRLAGGDQNGDGFISNAEFLVLAKEWGVGKRKAQDGRDDRRRAGRGAGIWDRIATFDKNKDGKITKEEAVRVWGRLESLDKNKDGVITKKELGAGEKKDEGNERRRRGGDEREGRERERREHERGEHEREGGGGGR